MAKANILVVEDEIVVAQSIRAVLENRGYAVSSIVMSGEAAIESAARVRPDLVLMDIFLSGEMDGITAAGIIHTHYHTPVVFLTAYSEKHLVDRAKTSNPFGYLIKPFRDEELLSTVDITLHRAKVEKDLRESENLYRSFMDRSPIPIFIHQQGRFVYLNGAAVELHHANRAEELIDKRLTDFVHPDYRKEVSAGVRERPQNARQRITELKLVQPAAEPVDIEASSIPVEFKGKFSRLVFYVDITRRKRAEESLNECRARFQALADASPAVILILGAETILYANPALERITGRTMGDILSMNAGDLVRPDSPKHRRGKPGARTAQLKTMRELLGGTGRCERKFIDIVDKNGELRRFDCAAVHIQYEKRPAVLLIGCDASDSRPIERRP